ncbi:MAG: hypothetical protein Q4Q06_05485 [Bacteroidota bacterium]|nr:hypothetical protein [Bacteroidota bacterium]
MIPQIINNIVQYLKESNFSLSCEFEDGRLNSARNDKSVIF